MLDHTGYCANLTLELTPAGRIQGLASLMQPIVELRQSQQSLSQLLGGMFAEVESRKATLEQKTAELGRERAALAARQAELDERLSNANAGETASQADAQAQTSRVSQLETQCAELQKSLDTARVQISQLAGAALELADLRARMALAGGEPNAAGAAGREQADHQRQRNAWEHERRGLKSELAAARAHAVELADHLAEMRRRFVEERAEWNAELRHLRRLLERQSQSLEDCDSLAYGSRLESRDDADADPLDANYDSMLGAMMAQFAQLQHDPADDDALRELPLSALDGRGAGI